MTRMPVETTGKKTSKGEMGFEPMALGTEHADVDL